MGDAAASARGNAERGNPGFVDGIPEPLSRHLLVDRHPTDDTLFSTVVLLSGLKTDRGNEAGTMELRLPQPEGRARAGNVSLHRGPL